MEWNYLKYKIRQFAKQYSIVKAKERRAKRVKLELSKSQRIKGPTFYRLTRDS